MQCVANRDTTRFKRVGKQSCLAGGLVVAEVAENGQRQSQDRANRHGGTDQTDQQEFNGKP
jgi:hypothetical protein